MATLCERQKRTFVSADECWNSFSIADCAVDIKDSMDKLNFTNQKKVWNKDVQDFGRSTNHQDPMTYVLASSRGIPNGFIDLKQDLLLDDHDCHDSELCEECLEELRAINI